MTWLRKQKKHGRGRQELETLEGLFIVAPDADPRLEWIYRQIAELDEVNRSLALLLLDGYSYREMSAILGLTDSNVGVKINRIKSALAGKLAKETP
jgi:RNA polymerase sigma-70 factor (ECF subfamily)